MRMLVDRLKSLLPWFCVLLFVSAQAQTIKVNTMAASTQIPSFSITNRILAVDPRGTIVRERVRLPKLLHSMMTLPTITAPVIKGECDLSFVVSTTGDVGYIKVEHSLRSDYDRDAISSLEKWHFQAATLDGQPVAMRIKSSIDF
jgi:TonB family protein